MNEKNPLERAREYIWEFKRTKSEGCKEDGEKIIQLFPKARVLFLITLPPDFLEKSGINFVKQHHGYSFRLKVLDYHISKARKILDKNCYNDLCSVPSNPPRYMNDGNKIIKGINEKGTEINCDNCDGRGDVQCDTCNGMGKWTCQSCGGHGKNTCSSCGGKGQKTCASCGGEGQRDCPSCAGEGHKNCPSCGGTGQIDCPSCGGDGQRDCPSCGGEGYAEDYRNGRRYICPSCNGFGTFSCSFCAGTGGVYCSLCQRSGTIECTYCGCSGVIECPLCIGSGVIECSHCKGIGTIVCNLCKGSGEIICSHCNGEGKIVCSICKGYGSLMDADVWQMETRTYNEDYPLKLDIPNYVVNNLKGKRSYEKDFINDDLPWILNDTQISRCEVKGTGFEVCEINYLYNGSKYSLFKEDGGEFYWDKYPKDWKKIGIFSLINLIIIFVIVILLNL